MKVFCFILGLLSGLVPFVTAVVSFLLGAAAAADNTRPEHYSTKRQTDGVYSK